MAIRIFHNPRCSKSRATLALLEQNGVNPEIVDYKADAPSPKEIASIAALLDLRPIDITRQNDARDAGLLDQLRTASDTEICELLHRNPALIERPIVVADNARAVIGRPPENVLKLL